MIFFLTLALQSLVPLSPPPVPVGNQVTDEKVVLGKMLFWEEQLSSDNTIACGTCHRPETGGAESRNLSGEFFHPGVDAGRERGDDSFGSPGVALSSADGDFLRDSNFDFGPQVTRRLAPTVIAAAYFTELFWDGRAAEQFLDPQTGQISLASGASLESQVAETLLSSVEMSSLDRTWDEVIAKLIVARPLALATDLTPDIEAALSVNPNYEGLFAAAFGTTDITADRICRAIATYMRVLVPDQTPFDLFAAGDSSALTIEEQQGLLVVRTIGRCAECHFPPLFGSDSFRNIGLRPADEDLGRFILTGAGADRGSFKVPTLRNVALRERFFHNGALTSLREVLDFYARGGDFGENRDAQMGFISLPPATREFAIRFLKKGLVDPRVVGQLPPFDRPTLFSERPGMAPRLHEAGVRGALGKPELLVTSPASLEAGHFRVGLYGASSGSFAVLRWRVAPAPIGASSLLPLPPDRTGALGAQAGSATRTLDLESLGLSTGQALRLQWLIRDPSAANGIAASDCVEVTVF